MSVPNLHFYHQHNDFRWAAVVVILLVACGGGSGSGNDNNADASGANDNTNNANSNSNCTDLCSAVDDTRCESGWVQRCETVANGCLDWQRLTDCASANRRCDQSQQPAVCVTDCSLSAPDAPTSPMPPDGNTDVRPSIGILDWADSDRAARYAVYHGEICPPPAYPSPSFVEIATSSLPGAAFASEAEYCWQVVSIGTDDCTTVGPVWTFTTVCDDQILGPPTVTSSSETLPPLTTSDTYTLNFNEPVNDVLSNLTWISVLGSGTMGTPVQLSAMSYSIPYSGVAAGDSYTLTVGAGVTDNCGNPLSSPVEITFTVEPSTGETCAEAWDISSATFPFQLMGNFTDDPSTHSDCSYGEFNAVWYRFSPATSGEYQIMARNYAAGNSYSIVTVFQSLGCQPPGPQVDCMNASGKIIYELAYMEAGQDYMILFHTQQDIQPMVDPEISITPSTTHPAEYCPLAVDVSSSSMPVTLSGTFDNDPGVTTSCLAVPRNVAWFTYTPTTTMLHNIDASNAQSHQGYLVAFEGVGCPPSGVEALCVEGHFTGTLHHEQVLTAGQPYTFMYSVSADFRVMTDPEINIAPWTPLGGEACSNPNTIHLGSESSMSYGSGTYTYEFDPGPSCEPNPYNQGWFRFVPQITGWHNFHFTSGLGWDIRMAVFEGDSCAPYGPELTCIQKDTYRIRTKLHLTAGTPYLIMLMTNDPANNITGPGNNIYETTPPPPGWDCSAVATITSSNHTGGSQDRWDWPADLYDNRSDHTFSCDTDTGADVVVEYTTGPSQTTLNWSVYRSNGEPGGGIALQITDGPCDTGASMHCAAASFSPYNGQLFVVPNTTYYVWVGELVGSHSLSDISVRLW